MWMGKLMGPQPQTKNHRQLTDAEEKKSSSLGKSIPTGYQNTKWSALWTCIRTTLQGQGGERVAVMNTISISSKINWAEQKCLSSTETMPQITSAHPAPRKIPFYKIHRGLPQKQFCPTSRMPSRCLCLFMKDHFHLLWSPQAFTSVSSSFLIYRQWLYLGPCTQTWRAWAVRPQSKFGEHTGPELGSKSSLQCAWVLPAMFAHATPQDSSAALALHTYTMPTVHWACYHTTHRQGALPPCPNLHFRSQIIYVNESQYSDHNNSFCLYRNTVT